MDRQERIALFFCKAARAEIGEPSRQGARPNGQAPSSSSSSSSSSVKESSEGGGERRITVGFTRAAVRARASATRPTTKRVEPPISSGDSRVGCKPGLGGAPTGRVNYSSETLEETLVFSGHASLTSSLNAKKTNVLEKPPLDSEHCAQRSK